MQRSAPFARAMAMAAAIMGAMSLPASLQQAQLAEIGPYRSRGKGRNSSPIGRKGGHMAAVRAASKARNVRRHKARAR